MIFWSKFSQYDWPEKSYNLQREIPNEVILNILKHSNLLDLLNLSLIKSNERIKCMINKVLIEKLSTVKLRLLLNQENNWKYTVDFKLKKTANTTRLGFVPVSMDTDVIRLYTSKLLRKPMLMKATLLLDDDNKYLKNNLFKSSLAFNIKDVGPQQVHDLQQKLVFKYHVKKTPKNVVKARPGERFIEPVGFECPIEFLSQPKSILQKLSNYLHTTHKPQHVEMSQFFNKYHQGTPSRRANDQIVPILQYTSF